MTAKKSADPLDELKPNPRNPRKPWSNDQARNFKRSLQEFGDLSGIIRNRTTGQLIGGHKRVEAFREFSKTSAVKIKLRDCTHDKQGTVAFGYVIVGGARFSFREVEWPEAKERAANIAANQWGAEFDDPSLASLMTEINGSFDLDLTGFSPIEVNELLHFDENTIRGKVRQYNETPFSVEQIQRCAIQHYSPLTLDEMKKILISLPEAMIQFNRLCQGYDEGYWISFCFNPHRLTCKSAGAPTMIDGQSSSAYRKRWAMWRLANPSKFWLKEANLGYGGVHVAAEFRPWIARDICKKYIDEESHGRVLDPCHCWGGRLIGCMASNRVSHYCGFDPSQKTSTGVKELHKFLGSGTRKMSATLRCEPFESCTLKSSSFDLAITSPPYFDTELYEGENQSHACYKTLDEWRDGFYRPLITKTIAALKPGRPFILNVGSLKYPLADMAHAICKQHGFECSNVTGGTLQIGGAGLAERGENAIERGEVFLKINSR